jgi:hypothetical protein
MAPGLRLKPASVELGSRSRKRFGRRTDPLADLRRRVGYFQAGSPVPA